jgi:hypothetical protein
LRPTNCESTYQVTESEKEEIDRRIAQLHAAKNYEAKNEKKKSNATVEDLQLQAKVVLNSKNLGALKEPWHLSEYIALFVNWTFEIKFADILKFFSIVNKTTKISNF